MLPSPADPSSPISDSLLFIGNLSAYLSLFGRRSLSTSPLLSRQQNAPPVVTITKPTLLLSLSSSPHHPPNI
ncbi:hypothetical protein AAHA92_09905 [Salvia divinorum]|uniref:Uncharacterized protein n=1 Tax=Salvia divinorum TaxID=28513 RepID=A0ABD1HSX5_SALDI